MLKSKVTNKLHKINHNWQGQRLLPQPPYPSPRFGGARECSNITSRRNDDAHGLAPKWGMLPAWAENPRFLSKMAIFIENRAKTNGW
jgi:hypothetical protein